MPCWEIREVTVEFKAQNKDLLLEALKQLGVNFKVNSLDNHYIWIDNEIQIDLKAETVRYPQYRRYSDTINRIKVEYSKLAVMKAAKLRKWAVRAKGENKFQLVRS